MKIRKMKQTFGVDIGDHYSIWGENLWPYFFKWLIHKQTGCYFSLIDFSFGVYDELHTWQITVSFLGFHLVIKRNEDFSLAKAVEQI